MFSEEKTKKLMDHFGVKSIKQLEIRLGLSNGYISNLQRKGTENPGRMLVALNENGISADWFFSVSDQMVLGGLKKQPVSGAPLQQRVKKTTFFSLPNGGNGATIEAAPETGGAPGSTSAAGKGTMKADVVRTDMRGGEIPLIYPGDERLKQGIIIPYLEDQKVSAGYGAELEEEEWPSRYFRVPAYLGRYPDLATLPVKGDSMDPTLHDGDLVVCDGGGWDGDGIYVIKTSDEAFIKRVVSTSQGYQVISDNKTYPSYGESKQDVTIVGKVRAALIAIPGRRGGI
jgi:phage repressor protein C with HTH and peptisase S24 domain